MAADHIHTILHIFLSKGHNVSVGIPLATADSRRCKQDARGTGDDETSVGGGSSRHCGYHGEDQGR